MTPRQKKIRNTLEREYLADLRKRKLKSAVPAVWSWSRFPMRVS